VCSSDLEGTDAAGARIRVLTKDFGNASKSSETYTNKLDDVNQQLTETDSKIQTLITSQKKLDAAEKKSEADAKKLPGQRARQQEKDRVEALRSTQELIKRQDFLNKQDLKNLRTTTDERRKIERDSGIVTPTTLPTVPPAMPMNAEKIAENANIASGALKQIKDEADLTAAFNLINGTFFSPIEDLFSNFLETGKFAFKEFAQSILKAISQIVAKVIATGIISLLATIFSGGFSSAAGGAAGGFKTVLGAITSALGFGGGQKVAAPSFSGVSGGGMQMAGAVNLTLRGSDLVGSINRTNSTISRVG
jgi:hypothetical protein